MIKILVKVIPFGNSREWEWYREGEQEYLIEHATSGEVEEDADGNLCVYAIFEGKAESAATMYCMKFNRRIPPELTGKIHPYF